LSPTLLIVCCAYFFIVFVLIAVRCWNLLAARDYVTQSIPARSDAYRLMRELQLNHEILKRVAINVAPKCSPSEQGKPVGPFTFGVFSPVIVLPSNYQIWETATLKRVIAHELAHVMRDDWFWQNILQFLAAFIWFLPSAWRLNKQFSWLIELNADDGVLFCDDNRSDYATDLLRIASGHQVLAPSVTALIDGSYCYERIAAVLDGSRLRSQTPFRNTSVRVWLMALLGWLLIASVNLSATAYSFHNPVIERTSLPFTVAKYVDHKRPNDTILTPLPPVVTSAQHDAAIDAMVLIEREYQATKAQIIESLQRDVETLASSDFDRLADVPSVTVHGYIAVRSVVPEYPRRARKNNIEGQVIVQFDILPSGQADAVRIAMATPSHVFNNAVLEAMAKSVFKPAVVDGRPVKTQHATQTFTFKLSESEKQKNFNPPFGTPIKTATAE
ncbi:MAG TPA: M56 family metallopeptidase, partial [Marinagarivorans sp.]